VDEVIYVLQEEIKDPLINVVSINGRTKSINSLLEKINRKQYQDPLNEITDFAGVRVVCNYESDLDSIGMVIRLKFNVHEHLDKSRVLDVDRMGYHGLHYVVSLGESYSGSRYNGITHLKCEIQVRTVLQDAWALISHHLVYKDEETIPQRLRRDLNNVASLLEIAQGVFDSVRDKRENYVNEIERNEADPKTFMSQPIDYDTLRAYTKWKFPDLPISEQWHVRLLHDLDLTAYKSLADIDVVVEMAKQSVEQYRRTNPEVFGTGTDFITKSLGFVDSAFRQKHPWGKKTIDAFKEFGHWKWQGLVKNPDV
jgi:putative GTP pyrophosphokinase